VQRQRQAATSRLRFQSLRQLLNETVANDPAVLPLADLHSTTAKRVSYSAAIKTEHPDFHSPLKATEIRVGERGVGIRAAKVNLSDTFTLFSFSV
jgi:hypothetical protein